MRFRSNTQTQDPPTTTPAADAEAAGQGKGHATPSRKDAQAARKHTLKVSSDPKTAKKAARARASAERHESRAALMSGDEKSLPSRDAGPVKAEIRNFIDSRYCAAELFLPVALLVLAIGFVRIPQVQASVTMFWMLLTLFMVVDTTLLLMRLNKSLKIKWPSQIDRKGSMLYALMRVVQLRKLRLPPPKVRGGGKPVVPKVKKQKG